MKNLTPLNSPQNTHIIPQPEFSPPALPSLTSLASGGKLRRAQQLSLDAPQFKPIKPSAEGFIGF